MVSIYFTYIEGFSSYKTELLTFNGIFLISTILYELLYLSFYLLQKQNLGAGVYFVNIQFEDASIAPVKTKVIFQ